ncbi:fungal-specific transcription factor domain-containing protein [Hyaloraphidium curvatum]|nr:fungal-specific transcription factor domain-containing protein [Hyaloraphidium curvatum]
MDSRFGGLDQATLAMLGVGGPAYAPALPYNGLMGVGALPPAAPFDVDAEPALGVVGGAVGKGKAQGKRRVRVTKACDLCSKKKIKCDGLLPACTRCFVNNLSCAYSRNTKKRGPAPGSIVSLHKRLKRLEYLLEKATGGKGEEFFDEMDEGGNKEDEDSESEQWDEESLEGVEVKQEPDLEPVPAPAEARRPSKPKAVPGAHANGVPAPQPARTASGSNLPRPAADKGPESPVSQGSPVGGDDHSGDYGSFIDYVSGGPTVLIMDAGSPSSVESRHGGSPAGPVVLRSASGTETSVVHVSSGALVAASPNGAVVAFDDLAPLPPQDVLDSLIEAYFKYLAPSTSFIHRGTFLRNLRAQPPMLLYSMYAIAAPFSDRVGPNRFKFAISMFERAKRLLYPALEKPPALVTIQTLLHLVLHGVTSWTQGSIAYQFTGIAIMMARQMKLNVDPDSDKFSKEATKRNMRWVEKETRRRVWWALYNLDRITAVAADRACIIADNECLTSLPCNPLLWDFDLPERGNSDIITSANMPAWVALFLSNPEEPLPDLTDADPFLYECMLNNVVGKIVEFHQWCAFRDINPFSPPANALGEAARKKMALVEEMLAKWFNLLPATYKVVRPGSAALPWMTLFLRTAVVLLHCPRDTKMLRLEKDVTWLSGDSFVRCSEESTHVAKLLEDMMAASPKLDGAVPYAVFSVFQTGLIHLVGIKNLQMSMINFCGDPACGGQELLDLVNEAKRQLEVHIRALRILGERWVSSERLATLLAKLLEDVQAPLVTGFGLLVAEDSAAGGKLFALLEIPDDMEAPAPVPGAACPAPRHQAANAAAASQALEPGAEFIAGGDFVVGEDDV